MSDRHEWFHYSTKCGLTLDRSRRYRNERADKPHGLWISPANDEGWRAWREGEDWGIPKREYVYRVSFTDAAKMLTLGEGDVRSLHERFPRGRIDEIMPFYPYYESHPSWETIMEEFDGVLIPEYHCEHRLNIRWYYGWDCASGCIWNLDAITDLTLTDTLIAAQRECVA